MNIVYEELVFPFKETNLERVVDELYFKIHLKDGSQEVRIPLTNERVLLEFSKSLKAACSQLQDYKTEPYVVTMIDLKAFLKMFSELYKLDTTVER